jgi:hypothetical protein
VTLSVPSTSLTMNARCGVPVAALCRQHHRLSERIDSLALLCYDAANLTNPAHPVRRDRPRGNAGSGFASSKSLSMRHLPTSR